MAVISKSFDAKINVIFPHISRSIPGKDSERIRTTNFFRYESQKTLQTQDASASIEAEEELTNASKLEVIDSELEQLEKSFKKLEDDGDAAFKGMVYTYNVQDSKNEPIENAERNVFGEATGHITFAKYKKAKEVLDEIDAIIRERMIQNGGSLNVS